MKAVERKLNKAQIATICLLIISLLLGVAYLVISGVAKRKAMEQSGTSTNTQTIDILEEIGESSYIGRPIAYSRVEETQMLLIEVDYKGEKYGVSRYPDDNGSFMFHTFKNGEEQRYPFIPPIASIEGDFNYESLYAIEQNDGFGRIPYLTYLCSALGAPYFTERIQLPAVGTDEYNAMLEDYGLTESERAQIVLAYGQRDPETNEIIEGSEDGHVITIGGKAVSGAGFYFMIDNRNYVYYTSSEYFSYALGGFASFVNGRLVAEGLSNDKGFSPYLTTDFKSWTGTTYDTDGEVINYDLYKDPTIVALGTSKNTVQKDKDKANNYFGYEVDDDAVLTFDLEALEDHPEYGKIVAAFENAQVGTQSQNILLTLLGDLHGTSSKYVSSSDTYTYTITAIESVLVGNSEITSGTVDSNADQRVKVTYRYKIGDTEISNHDCHAIIDLSKLTSTEQALFYGQLIGAQLASPIELAINYTDENTLTTSEEYVLKQVYAVFDEKGNQATEIKENYYINFSYYIRVTDENGKTTTPNESDYRTEIIRLSDLKAGDDLYPLRALLLDTKMEEYGEIQDKTVYAKTYRYELMREFSSYEISEIKYFVVNEMIVSFEFVNASERDPFYGDTFYRNTLENEYAMYGLNAGTCEQAVELLGGVGAQGSNSTGLTGETVAVGLTSENLYNYGLLAHKIYFEMPRGLYDKTELTAPESDDSLSDFGWLRTIGFTLYISDAKYDENGNRFRYIGSDMYDIIAKVYSSDFDFVEYGFVEFWARRNMVMMNVENLEELKLEFNMSDLSGKYSFSVGYEIVNNETQQKVYANAAAGSFETEFTKQYGTGQTVNLAELYKKTLGYTYYPGSKMTNGAAYFNSVYQTLMLTAYLDCFEDGVLRPGDPGFNSPKIMTMHLKVKGTDNYYTYDFYRVDDRRVMVALYRTDAAGNMVTGENYGVVSDFYITSFAFKKLVNNYIALLNGQPIDKTVGYPD